MLKKFFGTFSWYTTFPQSFKSLSLLEQKLGWGGGGEKTPFPRPEEPQKAQAE